MIETFFQYLLPFSLLLGTLVTIHELGHFLVARYFGVRVEVFSIGFGPKILKFKKGDTLYCVSIIPLGGYVKMFGDNPKKLPTGEDRKIGFLSQSVKVKSLIALGGPLMNFFLAVVLFMFLSFLGKEQALPVLGDIKAKTNAYKLGFRSGDKILSINDQKIDYWNTVQNQIRKNPEKNLSFKIKRSGSVKTLQVAPQKIKSDKLGELKKFVGEIEGLSIVSTSAHIGISSHRSIAYRKGLRTFDEIKKINKTSIANWKDLERFIKNNKGKSLVVTVQRDQKEKTLRLPAVSSLKRLGVESTELYIDRVKSKSPADRAGLQEKDRFFALNGKRLKNWDEFSSLIKKEKDSEGFNLTLIRDGKRKKVFIQAEKMPTIQENGVIQDRPMIGVASAQYISFPPLKHTRTLNPLKALFFGVQETLKWSAITGKVLWRVISGNISYRVMGGPLSIAKAAKNSFSESLSHFLLVMAIISVNLFLMNLLPIPVLDGGHLLLFTIEGIRGKALNPKNVEMAQLIGFSFLLFFIVLTVFNDIGNWNLIW